MMAVFELFRALKVNKTLEKVDLGDNQFNTTEDTEEKKIVIGKIYEVLTAADVLLYYDFRFNNILEEGKIQRERQQNKHDLFQNQYFL